ncbi:BspA family leucine-rich repeat surface protein [Winogradskyella flava]|uniref:BspA family leucine-rich repeat surface protein n=1 Tax=Winogradskyella flava TaxID=1884876 RepID=A0A842IK25_9FLAO|nr:BspA family leucine-rich repeat surface protein [Winogradskyella flava]MBC2843642.1 BspA family leucine-rich repeat surface protein [Winogradskyella flava]
MKLKIFTIFLLVSIQLSFGQFITTWETTSNNQSIIIPTNSVYTYNYDIDWGDGTTSTNETGNAQHTYADSGTYTVSISGLFPAIYFNSAGPFNPTLAANRNRIKTIEQWGTNSWLSMNNAFSGCSFLTVTATDNPDLSQVTDMSLMFFKATNLTGDLSDWDINNVTQMNSLFNQASNFNSDISSWDVSNVTQMNSLFSEANSFNIDISSWDVSNVIGMSRMFYQAAVFNQDIGTWDVSNVTNMNGMFRRAFVFNQDIGNWNVSNVTDMSEMFEQALVFNQNIGSWDVGSVTNMNSMFLRNPVFNQPIGSWDVGNVQDMSEMFRETPFNNNINNWNVGNVLDMSFMFSDALLFNQDIGDWNVLSVTDMSFMLNNAVVFNQNLGNWDINNVVDMFGMLSNTMLTVTNYDATLIGWAAQTVNSEISLSADGLIYCNADTARTILTSAPNNWSITDDQLDCSSLPNFNIPDPNFEQALIDLNIDSDGIVNGQMLESDALGVTDLDVNSYNISDLSGIEFFADLEVLTAFNNNLNAVDLSQNEELTTLLLALNNLSEIDLFNNPNLVSLSLNENNLEEIDLSNNLLLTQVFLNQNNLDAVDVSMLVNLQNLGLSFNNIVELDISQNSNVTSLFCNDNDLVSLIVNNGNNTNFSNFEAQNNIDLSCITVDDINYSDTNWLNTEPQFNFDAQTSFGIDCAPTNDDCLEASTLTLATLISGTTFSATSSSNFPSCQEDTIVLIDVWYQFTAPSSGAITAVASTILSSLNINLAIYNNCNEVEPISCDSGTVEVTNLVPGETYYLQIWIGGNPNGRSQQNTNLVGDFNIEVVDSSTLSIDNNTLNSEITLFPNPANTEVNIQVNSNIDGVSLFDIAGKEVRTIKSINQQSYILNLEDLSKGLYTLQIQTENSVISKKLLIK